MSTKVGRQGDGSLIAGDDDLHSNRLAHEHSSIIAFLSPLVFRPESTDAIVINELLDPIKGSIYSLKQHLAPTMPSGFSLTKHDSVLDVGAHIGVFSRLAILLSEDAARRSSWLDCTHLVFEWSFTKERRVDVFHKAVVNLERAGFELHYEGKGSWWDTDIGTLWPYPNDVIVFAAMKQ